MKKLFLIVFMLSLLQVVKAQNPSFYPGPNQGGLAGGMGMTWIDGKPYYTLHFRPELSFANWGLGIDLNLDFDTQGKVRHENFNEFSDYLSVIRYVRYGYKGEPLYGRLGALDYASMGHGSIIYMYNNSPSFDVRKVGLELDMDFDKFGFETVYGNFGQAGVTGVRGFVRPLKFTQLAEVPIISSLEIGASFAEDFNKYSGVTKAQFNDSTKQLTVLEDMGRTKIVGADIGLPVHFSDMFTATPYFDYAKIVNFGHGTALGLKLDLHGLGLVTAQAKLERRFNGDNYLPSYFNSLYEIERFMADPNGKNTLSKDGNISKAARLQNLGDPGNGYYGELLVRVFNAFDILGSYQRLDKDPKSGILHLVTDISPKDGSYVARAGYDKIRIEGEKDLFTLDDRSYLYAEVGYKPLPFMLVSLVYNWTFSPVRDVNDNVVDFVPQKKIEPRVSFVFPFGM
ncbi:MAG: hypothetical protein ACM3QX_17200 [Syntrophomonadaceae bacterium]